MSTITARGFSALRLRAGLLASAAFIASAASASAQITDPVAPMDEVVVTARHYVPTTNTSATKVAIPLIETPQSISVITRDQIDVLNMQDLQQAVRYTAGIVGENFGPDQRYDFLTLRGFSPVEYVDGLQAPVGSISTIGLDLWGAESIEVLKGPSGVLYGQTPPGGIINYTSRRPEAAFGGELQAQLGSYDDRQIAGDVTGSLTGDGLVTGRLTGLWRERDTQINGANSRRIFIAPAATWNIDGKTHLTILSYYQNDKAKGGDGGFLPAQGTLLANPNGKIPVGFNAGEPGYNLFKREQYGVGYEFTHQFNDHVAVVQNLKYAQQKIVFNSVYGTGLLADNRTLTRANFLFPEDVKSFAVDTRIELRGDTGPVSHTALIGLDYRDVKNHTGFEFGSAPSIDVFNPVYGAAIPAPFFVSPNYIRTDTGQTGIYVQDSMKLGRLRFTASAREDHLTGPVKDDAFTYRVGANYLFDGGLAPYVAYATSFLPTAGATFAGAAFQPSKGKQIEAGLKYEPRWTPRDVKVFASAAVYDLTQDNVLTNDPAHAFFSVQTGEVEVKGAEFEAVARIRERLSVNASYSYTDSEVTRSNGSDLGKQIPIVPRHKAGLLVDYTEQTGLFAGLGGGLGLRYLGTNFGDPANTLKAQAETLVDALVHYDFQKWRLSVNASNVFDKVYVQRCSDLNTCFYSERRQVLVSLNRKF